jgi:hypothetical protein
MKDEGGSVALNPDPMSGMKDEPSRSDVGQSRHETGHHKRSRRRVPRRCAVFRAHLGKACASSKKSSGFSKMRTFRLWCASSNMVRIFEGRAAALHPVPLSRKVVNDAGFGLDGLVSKRMPSRNPPSRRATAHVASLGAGSRAVPWYVGFLSVHFVHLLRQPEGKGDPQITPI